MLKIDIEGVIGTNEKFQFDNPENKVSTLAALDYVISCYHGSAIEVNIRTTGGDFIEAIRMYERLIHASRHIMVKTISHGYTASAGTIIAQAASYGQRHIDENALVLCHLATGVAEGSSDEMLKRIVHIERSNGIIAQIYASHSKMTVEVSLELMSQNSGKGEWISAYNAVELGLYDNIVKKPNEDDLR